MSYDAIPAELRELARWVVWCWGDIDLKTGKRKKPPYPATAPRGHRHASNQKPEDWSPFQRAAAVVEAGEADGIGFALGPPWVGVDLDEELAEADQAAIMLALDSYSERSVSGTGHHVVLKAALNGHGRHPVGIGVFQDDRFFYFSGEHIVGTPATIEDRQAQLDQVLEQFLPKRSAPETTAPAAPVGVDDRDLLDKALAARNGADFRALWEGAWDGRYDSQSQADQALCNHLAFWTGRDPDRIDRLFRSSGLRRPKWERADYRERTIREAIDGCHETYAPQSLRPEADAIKHGSPPESENGSPPLPDGPVLIDLREIQIRNIDWYDKPYLPRGELVVNIARGGTGKGLVSVYYAAKHSLGEIDGTPRMSVFAVAEDAYDTVFKPRLIAAGADFEYIRTLRWRRRGYLDTFVIPDDLPLAEKVITDNAVVLLVIDPLLSHLGAKTDSYKDHEVKRALTPLGDLAQRTGCTIIGNLHFKKDASRGARNAAQASSAFVDVPRVAWGMAKEPDREGVRVLEVIKSNIGPQDVGRDWRVHLVAVEGLNDDVPMILPEGAATRTIDELLARPASQSGSRTEQARELILDILDEGAQESDALDARVAHETGLAAKTVRNVRSKLSDEGLVKPLPVKDEDGSIFRWTVYRTGAPRP